jgi:Rps23 Pro-64 3,4-dihydroxylase Tpa1-like proline 4-hydroxylase
MIAMHAQDELSYCLDEPYLVNPSIVGSIKSVDSMTILGIGNPFELPLALFQVLMGFAEAKTPREAFAVLDVDVPLDEFGKIVGDLAERGLLTRERPVDRERNLREFLEARMLPDAASIDKVSVWMRQGRAIIVPDALPADLAEQAHQDLSRSSRWVATESGHDFFHLRSSVIPHLGGHTAALTECERLFKCSATRAFISELSGEDCTGEASVAAAWYRPNEYALPHDDTNASNPRAVAYVWYLTKDWKREWGGALFWCPTGQYICPRFNMLVMFKVMPSNMHLICPIAPTATGKRLTINGFWNRSRLSTPLAALDPGALISPRAYGPCAPEALELGPVVVL